MCLIVIPLYICQPAGRPANGQLKIVQKTFSFAKRMLLAMQLLWGGRPCWPGLSHMYNLFIFVSNNPVLMS